jgi:hypothetical protein
VSRKRGLFKLTAFLFATQNFTAENAEDAEKCMIATDEMEGASFK